MSFHFTRYSCHGMWIGDCATEKWLFAGVECLCGTTIRSCAVA